MKNLPIMPKKKKVNVNECLETWSMREKMINTKCQKVPITG